MNKITGLMVKPFEKLAGVSYPNVDEIARAATFDGASGSEVDISITNERREFRAHLIHFDGLRKILGRSET